MRIVNENLLDYHFKALYLTIVLVIVHLKKHCSLLAKSILFEKCVLNVKNTNCDVLREKND